MRFLAVMLLTLSCQTTNFSKKNNKKVIESQKNIVISYLNSGLPSQAHAELRRILRQHPDNVDFLGLMGLTQLALENPVKAVSFLQEAWHRSGKTRFGLNLSSALIAAGELKRAERLILSLLRVKKPRSYPRLERIYHNLGLISQKRKDYMRAEGYYRRALEENPSYYLTLLKIGLLYKRQRSYPNAIYHLNKAMNFCRKCFEPVKYLGDIYLAQGKQHQALSLVDKFSRQSGLDQKEQRRALAFMRRIRKGREL